MRGKGQGAKGKGQGTKGKVDRPLCNFETVYWVSSGNRDRNFEIKF